MENIFKKVGGYLQRVLPPPGVGIPGIVNYNPLQSRTLEPAPAPNMSMAPNMSVAPSRSLPPTSGTLVNQPSRPTPTQNVPKATSPLIPKSQPSIPVQPSTPTQNPYDSFNLLLQDALKKAQGIDTTDMLKQQRALSRESIARGRGDGIGKVSSEERKFLSPGQQASMRGADVGALESDIDETAFQITRANQDRTNLIEQIQFARESGDAIREADLKERMFQEQLRANKESERIAGMKASSGGDEGLSTAQKAADIRSIRGAFDNEQIVKDFNTSTSSINTLRSIGTDSKNPADDIAYIYAFAKIMDPNSVVREGEYKTVQDYAQALVQRYATGIKRVVDNSNFLTQDAKQKMLSTLESKVSSQKKSYENLSKEYQRQINDVYAGKPVTITNYGGVEPSVSGGTDNSAWLTDYNYDRDITDAREAIQQGADVNTVRQRLLQKYKQVDL